MNFLHYMAQKISASETGIHKMTGETLLNNALNLTYFVAGIVAVVVIIFAGIMYTTSSGDAQRVGRAKNLLAYAITGLVVVLMAFAITNFVRGGVN